MAKLTKLELEIISHAKAMQHMGGFYTADRLQWRRCERLRERGLLKFWNDRKSRYWTSQFYTITDKGNSQ